MPDNVSCKTEQVHPLVPESIISTQTVSHNGESTDSSGYLANETSPQTATANETATVANVSAALSETSDRSIRLEMTASHGSGSGRKCVLLVRHGESEGNVDPSVYEEKPDHVIRLTKAGLEMSARAGQVLREYMQEHEIHHARMMVSPFFRTRETAAKILEECGDYITHGVSESPLLVEQDWGLFEGSGISNAKKLYPKEFMRMRNMRSHKGSFYARMPQGESFFDVCIRVQDVVHAIRQEFLGQKTDKNQAVIIVTHGVTLRAFVMMWCHYPPEWVDRSHNPRNCSVLELSNRVKNWDNGYIFGGFDRQRQEVLVKKPPQEECCDDDTEGSEVRNFSTAPSAEDYLAQVDVILTEHNKLLRDKRAGSRPKLSGPSQPRSWSEVLSEIQSVEGRKHNLAYGRSARDIRDVHETAPHLRAYSDVADHSHTAADLLLHRQPSSATSSGGRDSWARRHWSSLARRATEESHPTEENHSGGNAPSGRQVSPRRRRYTAPAGGGDVVLHAESQVPRAGTALAAVPETCNAVPPSVESAIQTPAFRQLFGTTAAAFSCTDSIAAGNTNAPAPDASRRYQSPTSGHPRRRRHTRLCSMQ